MRLLKHRVLGLTVFGLGSALLLAGCGAGQITQTNTQQAAVNGAYGQTGKVVIRDAAVINRNSCEQAYPQGDSASLRLWVINQGPTDDLLVSVNSELASGGVIAGDEALVAGRTLAVGSIDQTPQTSATSPTSTTGSTSATSGAPSSAVSSTSAASTSGASIPADLGHASVTLQGLKRAVWPGQTVKVTFVFRDAGPLTVDLPIAAPTKPLNCEVHTEIASEH